ncbi:MAG: M20 metallopeptidase family protein [Brevinema sp.]
MSFLENARTLDSWLSSVRRNFHMNPELGFEEFQTSATISQLLEEMKFSHQKEIAITGITAHIPGKDPSITIALRADIDALPILEANNVPYKSKIDGKMHACGHDAHTTVALGVAKMVSEGLFSPPCNLKLIFQPAEETTGGAVPMIEAGVMKDVSAILGIHVNSALEAGTIGVRYGAMQAASDGFSIKIMGRSGHGAYPSDAVDAIVIAAQVINAIQTIVSRNTDARDSLVISIGIIKGGTASNIICDCVELHGTIRSLNPQTREYANKRVQEIVEHTATMMGGKGEFERKPSYTMLINHNPVVSIVEENAKKMLGDENVVVHQHCNMGVEDFAYYLFEAPGAFFHLGVGNKEKGITATIHNEYFDIDERALAVGVAMQCANIEAVYHQLQSGANLRDH